MDAGGAGSNGSCYYSLLGLRKNASSSEIRTAYRKLALKWHPDRWTKDPLAAVEAKKRFQRIQEAYSVLYIGSNFGQGEEGNVRCGAVRPARWQRPGFLRFYARDACHDGQCEKCGWWFSLTLNILNSYSLLRNRTRWRICRRC